VLDPSTTAASPVPNVPTAQITPDLAVDQEINPQTAPVPNVPSVSIAQATPDPATDREADPQAPSVPNVPNVPNATPTPNAHLTAPGELAEVWKSDPDQHGK